MCYLVPSMSDGCRGYMRAGFDWWSRNQQWGGPFGFMNLLDGATGNVYNGEAAIVYLVTHTPAECAAYVEANVTNLAQAKVMLGKFAMALSVLARRELR